MENFTALDSVSGAQTVSEEDDDPYNMQPYYDQVNEIERIRGGDE